MSIDVKVKRGLRLKIKGDAEKIIVQAPATETVAIQPTNFHSIVPKMLVKEGARLLAGDELFYSKYSDKTRFVSPVSGTVKEIVRGEKRKVLQIVITPDEKQEFKPFPILQPLEADATKIKELIFSSGLGAFIMQRPYDVLANAEDTPKAIYISAVDTTPLSADQEFLIKDKMNYFQTGINALTKLTSGKVYLGIDANSTGAIKNTQNAEIIYVSGPHPAGNVGVQIHHTNPINQGERVWTVKPEDVARIGELFETGKFNPERIIAVAGNAAVSPKYFKTILGAEVKSLLDQEPVNTRIISGNIFTGQKVAYNGYLHYHANELTLIPEGNTHRMFGWLPFKDNHIHSMSKTSLSWLFKNRSYDVNTNLNGEERALVVTGEMEEVMPMDIYPMQLLKACMAGDIEKMEALGIYEVIPEDFALIDYTNTSKIEAQEIIRQGLDLMLTEVG